MKIPFEEFEIKECTPEDIDEILSLQEETLAGLPHPDILRSNTKEMLESCLRTPHYTVGAWYDGTLAAITVLYVPTDEAEDLAHYLDGVDTSGARTANYKLCIVRDEFRGNGLQYRLGKMVEERAKELGFSLLCCTASPMNGHSIANIEKMGYTLHSQIHKYGFERCLFYKFI